jgi:AcrR family transcriptional regulator
MSAAPQPPPGETLDTRTRIAWWAQRTFAEKGYSQARVQDIAERAGVAPSLIIKYFGSKAELFREALKLGLEDATFEESLKADFGERLARAVGDPQLDIFAPAMIALSLGDDEARRIAAEVVRQQIVGAVANWVGGPDAEARAANIVMLSTGFAIFARHMDIQLSDDARQASAAWVARMLQELVDPPPADGTAAGG